MPLTLILSIGQDAALLDTRNIVLRAAGHVVESSHSIRQAIQQFQGGDFDLVLLCHSIPKQDRDRLTCLIRASGSHTLVVSITGNADQPYDDFVDATLECNPRKLLRGIKHILSGAPMRRHPKENTVRSNGEHGKAQHKTLLCIDDDPNLLAIRRRLLENDGYTVLTAHNGSDGLKVFSTGIVDAVILDYAMPMTNGGAVAAQIRQTQGDVPIILLSGCSTIPKEELALFDRFISKGDSPKLLFAAIEELLATENRKLRSRKPLEESSADHVPFQWRN
jgi:two-component system response regulator MprA